MKNLILPVILSMCFNAFTPTHTQPARNSLSNDSIHMSAEILVEKDTDLDQATAIALAEKLANGEELSVNDGNTYIVIEQVDYDNHTYLFLLNDNDELDSMFCEVNGKDVLMIEPELFKNKIFPLFIKKFTDKQ